MRIATAAYPLDPLADWAAYEAKITRWVEEAAGEGAELLVFPEYGAMELAMLDGATELEPSMRAVARHLPRADELHARLAASHGLHILAASAPVWDGADRPANRARLFTPEGRAHQDKLIMTMYERDPMDMAAGGGLQLFETALGRIGVLICYDSEFPLLGRALVEAGAEILLVPSCTDTVAGYWRVRIGAMARALEGQCVAIHSPTVGQAPWCPVADENHGAAAVYGPPDLGFPETGVIAKGRLDEPGWVHAVIDREAIARVRAEGRVRNYAHWTEQVPRLTVTRS